MRTIGILGGTSWPSTMAYYSILNQKTAAHYGGFASAPIILYSINYHAIKTAYSAADGWQRIPQLLHQHLRVANTLPIDALIIANNTLHRALDILVTQKLWTPPYPVCHALQLTAQAAARQNYRAVLLLGTVFTMQDNFFKQYFADLNIDVQVPNAALQQMIGQMQMRAAANASLPTDSAQLCAALAPLLPTVDAVVLGCTELPLLITPAQMSKPLLNPVQLQCDAAFEILSKS